MKISLEYFWGGGQGERKFPSCAVPEVISNRLYAAYTLKHYKIVLSDTRTVMDI